MDVKQETIQAGRENSASVRADKGEKQGEQLFNNRGLLGKGFLFSIL
jgi:hypothetical protein